MSKRADGSYSNAWRNVSKIILRPLTPMLMRRDWHGQENFPAEGGMILAANHLSYADVLALSLFADGAGRYPAFLAKASLFKIKILGPIIGKLGQLPVDRGQAGALGGAGEGVGGGHRGGGPGRGGGPAGRGPYHPAVARRKLREDLRARKENSSETEASADSGAPGVTPS